MQYNFVKEKPLSGDITLTGNIKFKWKDWFNGDYAIAKEKYLNDNMGFSNSFVRLRNQVYFSLFSKVYAKGVVCGKNGYLYELKYLKSHAGLDYIGEENTDVLFRKIKFIQDTLNKKNIKLIILLAPGKTAYYPEYIPKPYNFNSTNTNYFHFLEKAKKYNVAYYDLSKLFVNLKSTTKYPLYPKTGTHWSVFGMHVAFDSICRYIEKLDNRNLPKFDYSNVTLSYDLQSPDGDIEDGINLFEELPHFKMAYPKIRWYDTLNAYKPRVLTVADSYWMGVFFLKLPKMAFSKHEFWYYNKKRYQYDSESTNPMDVDLKQSVEKNDYIFILATEATQEVIGWGFIDELYKMYNSNEAEYKIQAKNRKKNAELYYIRFDILHNEDWYNTIKTQARKLNISLDSCMQLNIQYNYANKHKNDSINK